VSFKEAVPNPCSPSNAESNIKMHMADALVSPAVGAAFWTASAGTIALCSARVRTQLDDRKVPLMGVLGAFVFAAQMINFTIPATGSSGHLGGGLLLAILLGPAAAFLTIASVLMVQALFFADGGLLALGCNIFNLGIFPAFIAYPLIYRPLIGKQPRQSRMVFAAVMAAVVTLQCGSFAVVLQTVISGVSALPFATFTLLMQPIHFAIGLIEGIVTALLVLFVYRARPEVLQSVIEEKPVGELPLRSLLTAFALATLLLGGFFSWFASEQPDGLEWSIARITGSAGLPETALKEHGALGAVQEKTSFLADYALPGEAGPGNRQRAVTTLSGIVGGALTLVICTLIGVALRRWRQG
jgi:cobalt/nickel transport system permease protein